MKLDVRIHGRGGQGVVTAAELLSVAAFEQGLHAQALPSFGSERTGAPVTASCRISDLPIRSHDPISQPDLLVVQDLTLLRDPVVMAGLPEDGTVVVNTNRDLADLVHGGLVVGPAQRWVTIPANDLSRQLLGRPVPNTALVGAVAGMTDLLSPEAVATAIRRRFAGLGEEIAEANVRLAEQARDLVMTTTAGGDVRC
ncbi:2-oxoacid:acceptor oxidoreductase family protein [Nocardioides agariphilus]|jgi:pyruvate ferredoxin oxidoreductase gamma subunit|uniref:2-oxoacid:acceptor oxidoreductase family protein n=1 Tax=Nocardioides agariphilus TaxID=433664 RepID=A0A930VLZ9_9ACTN|nr:2-oxoacid:acceptor oxidoreductase family protein [Nocardioides agariphilus]MBF4767195.1 2-oxoacid:acceptor oxidoreductase family protein [Nocardioides agariphilus]